MSSAVASETARERVAAHDLWYHTMELAPGVVTPGWFDLRPVVDRMPWPDVRGKRCLDVGPYDGFLSFELERRGAAEVVAADIGSHLEWDWPAHMRERAPELAAVAGSDVGEGFRIARELLGSAVERVEVSAYDLSPERVGRFDFVVCGSLLLHLRDPVRALEAMASVCDGKLLSAETIRLGLTAMHPREPAAELVGVGEWCQWWVPNAAGHRRMLSSSGFEVERSTRPYAVPFGRAHPPARRVGRLGDPILSRLVPGWPGVPHSAALARARSSGS
jgi:tRNA (mo5U34)-methyltransferase